EYADLKIAVDHFVAMADPDGSFDDQQFHEEQRTASVTVTNGAVSVHAWGGGPIAATEMKAIFERAVDAEFQRDCDTRREMHGDDHLAHPLPRTAAQRTFDALHQIFLGSVTAPADGRRPEPVVNIVIDPTTAIEALARHGLIDIDHEAQPDAPVDPTTLRCHTSTGTPIHPDVAVKAMIRGSIRRVIVDANDVIINMGRTRRLFTGKARQAAQLLVTRCAHRGCDVPAELCDVDHVDEWSRHGGRTDQGNGYPACDTHDRWKHQQQLRGRRDVHGRLHLIKPDGTVIKPLNARNPVWADPDPPPSRTISWREWTGGRPLRAAPHPDATVTLVDLQSA
ncbi:MAG: HNH endonuclease, partial [Ilumatobacter sp.]|nr:HNH endonuclease [Ilumatobacter sp.]